MAYNTHTIKKTHTTHKERVLCYVRARRAARALHNTRHPTNKGKAKREEEERKKGREEESSVRTVEALVSLTLRRATTQHKQTTHRKKKKHGEQNKHKRTQTIQKTSTRTSTTNGHHTLPSMRNKTPIQQSW